MSKTEAVVTREPEWTAEVAKNPHPRRCHAKSMRTGKPCGKYAMKGQRVCRTHGGGTKAAMARAQERVELADLKLRGLTSKAVEVLENLIDGADSESVVLSAAKDILDRGGLKAKDRVEVEASITVTRPW
jgi:hypothetical protein